MTRRGLLPLAGRVLASALRAVPRAWRFGVARRVARALQPAIARTAACRLRLQAHTDGVAEITLDFVLLMLTRHGVAFDPLLRVEGEALLRPGSLLVGAHTMLNSLLLRRLQDNGHPACGVAADAGFGTPGTRAAMPILPSGPNLLRQVRRALAGGRTVVALIDRGQEGRRVTRFDTPAGTLRVSDALPRLALRLGVPIVFMATRLERGEVVCRLAVPAPAQPPLGALLEQFAAFVAGASARGLGAAVACDARPAAAFEVADGRRGDAPG